MAKRLLEIASIRSDDIVFDDVTIRIREPASDEFALFGTRAAADRPKAIAQLLSACITHENGEPVEYTAEECLKLVASARIGTKLLNVVMRLAGYGNDGEVRAEH